MSHSIIPPSSAGIWGKPDGCTYWPTMNQVYPETEPTIESLEGDASHEIGAYLIEGYRVGSFNAEWGQFDGSSSSKNIPFTEPMFEGAQLYADDVLSVMRETATFGGETIGVEQRLEMPKIHVLSFGTPDCFIFNPVTGELYIWDYKFGYEVVEAYENWQALNYAEGIFEFLEINGLTDQVVTVHIRIVQPRAHHRQGPIREWTVKGSDLRGYFNTLHNNAAKSLGADAEANTGSHCKHCPGRHACAPALLAGVRLYEVASKITPVELSRVALGVQLAIVIRARKQLELLETGFKEQVTGLIKSGKDVPGWITEPTYGNEKWDKPFDEVVAMGDMLGYDLRNKTNAAMRTPNQARQLGVDPTVITAYSNTPRTGLAIVPDNGTAKKVFS